MDDSARKGGGPALILASASPSRRALLRQAGIDCRFAATDLDEAAIKQEMGDATPAQLSERLALAKAMAVSRDNPDHVVLGADQLLVCENRIFDKPCTLAEAAEHLRFFRGRSHFLSTSYALVRASRTLAVRTVTPRLVMRNFSETFLQEYLAASGPALLNSVGCYLLEARGPQLFSEITGDYFTILGLPLLAVMADLRELDILDS